MTRFRIKGRSDRAGACICVARQRLHRDVPTKVLAFVSRSGSYTECEAATDPLRMRWSSFAAAAVSALALPPGTASASPRQIHIANGGVPVLSGLQTTPSPRISVLEKVPTISVSATEANALSAITLKDGELGPSSLRFGSRYG